MGQVTNGVAAAGANKTQTPSPVPSASLTQTGKDFDFSSLTHGMFSKQWVAFSKNMNGLSCYTKVVITER